MNKFTSRIKVSKKRNNFRKAAVFFIDDSSESVETDSSSDTTYSQSTGAKSLTNSNSVESLNKYSQLGANNPQLDKSVKARSLAPDVKDDYKPLIKKEFGGLTGTPVEQKRNFSSRSHKGLTSLRSYFTSFRAKLPLPAKQRTTSGISSQPISKKNNNDLKSLDYVKCKTTSLKNVNHFRTDPFSNIDSKDDSSFPAEKIIKSKSVNDKDKNTIVSSFAQLNLLSPKSHHSYPCAISLMNRKSEGKNSDPRAFCSTPLTSATASDIMSLNTKFMKSPDSVMTSIESSTSSSSCALHQIQHSCALIKEPHLSCESFSSSTRVKYSKTLPRSVSEQPLLEWTSLVNLSCEDRKHKIPFSHSASVSVNDSLTFDMRSPEDSVGSDSESSLEFSPCQNRRPVSRNLFKSTSEIPYKSLK